MQIENHNDIYLLKWLRQNTDNIKCLQRSEHLALLFTAGGAVKWYSHSGNTLAVSYKVKNTLTV